MKRYPYAAGERRAPERGDYVERFNTRVVGRTLPLLVAGE
jgi:hypothetical protein